jgi:hypothetical protein
MPFRQDAERERTIGSFPPRGLLALSATVVPTELLAPDPNAPAPPPLSVALTKCD